MHIICKDDAQYNAKNTCELRRIRTTYATNNMCNIREEYMYKTCIAILIVFVLFCFTYTFKNASRFANCDVLI